MQYTRNEVITGATVIAGTLLLVAVLIGMGNFAALFRDSYTIRVYFDEIGYLQTHAEVLQSGVRIGDVAAIDHLPPGEDVVLADGNTVRAAVRVTLSIYDEHTISPLSPVYIDTKGLLGAPFIAISGGPVPREEAVQPGEALMGRDAASMVLAMARLTDVVEGMGLEELDAGEIQRKVGAAIDSATDLLQTLQANVEDLEVRELRQDLARLLVTSTATMESASAVLAGATMQRVISSLDHLTANLDIASVSITRTLGRVQDDVENVLGETRQFIGQMNRLLDRNEENIDSILASLSGITADLDESLKPALDSAQSLLAQLDDFTSDNRQDLDEIIGNLRNFTRNAEDFSETISESPWQLLWKTEKRRKPPDEAPAWFEDVRESRDEQ